MYKRIKGIKGDFNKKERFFKDDDGMLITTEKEIAEKWRKYFKGLLNCEEPTEKFPFNIENINTQECLYPTLEEIKAQVHRLKNHKSPAEDCIQAELLKKGGENVIWWIWKVAVICPIHKKGDKQDCNNYRRISLLNVVELGAKTRRQGDLLSPILFNVVLEKVIKEMKIGSNEGIRLQDKSISLLAYADDIVLMEESQDRLKILFSRLHKAASKVGLCVNEEKTEYMFLSRLPFYQSIKIDQYEFKRVEQFKYLGSILSEKNNIAFEVAARIQAGNKCYYGLTKVLSSRAVSRRLKEQLYTSLILSVVLYGSETWPLRKMDKQRFMVFERKVLQKIYGPVKDEITEEWRRRKNSELETSYSSSDIVEGIRSRRLRWAGHAWRSQNPLLHAVIE
ncbi:uncharacterized protein LOC112600160 [Melanaphis sacchari]|uniref:uncharacterized protein LOC112600160 n=1 Tax=Melanaphis sacchari TaxID=742174 RepID=UPI000DC15966|nr:uncharacterized protein LOC112600160 [Melanaphis sacchari]